MITNELIEEKERFIGEIRESGSYSFPPSADYPVSDLEDGRRGMMFALLIAETKTKERIVLKAFSGMARGRLRVPGYANPCFSTTKYQAMLDESDREVKELTKKIEEGTATKEERTALTNSWLEKIARLYRFTDIDGNTFGIEDIAERKMPTGTGDCAGIKVLNEAMRRGYKINAFGEFFYGKDTKEKKSGEFYPPCTERCEKIIKRMLGLDFVYIDDDIAVVNKDAGLLSVPGRGPDKQDCVASRFRKVFPDAPEQPFVHRLDMDTSGLLILARTKEAQRTLSMDFEARRVHKEYEAVLDGRLEEAEGIIDLPMRLDVDNRPYQIVDHERGKAARTRFVRLGYTTIRGQVCTRVRYYPETGRTHQLRVHSASGLKMPIHGDRLYGVREEGDRLLLHAAKITFMHPSTREEMTIEVSVPF